MDNKYLTPEASAALTGFSPRSLRDPRFRARHGLRVIRVGRRLRFRLTDLEEWLERNRQGAENMEGQG